MLTLSPEISAPLTSVLSTGPVRNFSVARAWSARTSVTWYRLCGLRQTSQAAGLGLVKFPPLELHPVAELPCSGIVPI